MTKIDKESVELVKKGLQLGLPPQGASAALQDIRGESPEQADAEVAEACKEEGVDAPASGDGDGDEA